MVAYKRRGAAVRARRNWMGAIFGGLALMACVLTALAEFMKADDVHPALTAVRRSLGGSASCSNLLPSLQDWDYKGGVALWFVLVAYLFLGIAIVCDDYFVQSLEAISTALNLSEDVAGATFMAAGSSAPELFSSLVALVNPGADSELGLGTIVGSAVFNILMIIGLTTILAGQTLVLDYRPFMRDIVFYILATTTVILAFLPGRVYWWMGLIFTFLYAGYVVFMVFNKQYMAWAVKKFGPPRIGGPKSKNWSKKPSRSVAPDGNGSRPETPGTSKSAAGPVAESDEAGGDPNLAEEGDGSEAPADASAVDVEAQSPVTKTAIPEVNSSATVDAHPDAAGSAKDVEGGGDGDDEEDEEFDPFTMPDKISDRFMWALSLFWYAVFSVTIPKCDQPKWKTWYPLSFCCSVVWIMAISWFMVDWTGRIGCILGVPPVVMGVTILAAGTSIPDALSSILVARNGLGDMAVANAIGSNVFDIWVGLGLPWFFVLVITQTTLEPSDLNQTWYNVAILMGVLVFYVACVLIDGWRLRPVTGWLLIGMYVVYVVYQVVLVWVLDIYGTGVSPLKK